MFRENTIDCFTVYEGDETNRSFLYYDERVWRNKGT